MLKSSSVFWDYDGLHIIMFYYVGFLCRTAARCCKVGGTHSCKSGWAAQCCFTGWKTCCFTGCRTCWPCCHSLWRYQSRTVKSPWSPKESHSNTYTWHVAWGWAAWDVPEAWSSWACLCMRQVWQAGEDSLWFCLCQEVSCLIWDNAYQCMTVQYSTIMYNTVQKKSIEIKTYQKHSKTYQDITKQCKQMQNIAAYRCI